MIVTCPNCGAKYRLSDAVVARRARLRCAECEHRWVPETADMPAAVEQPPAPAPRAPVDEEAAFAAVQEQMQARSNAPAAAGQAAGAETDLPGDSQYGADADDAHGASDDETGDRTVPGGGEALRWLAAVIGGGALAVAAAGLWVGQVDPASLPFGAELLERLQPPSALELQVSGQTSLLPSGKRVLEISGVVRNTSGSTVAVPVLRASLSGPAGVALRWTIPPPVERLPPGREARFSGTVTGFPPGAQTLKLRAGR